jgi:hypothetical protein
MLNIRINGQDLDLFPNTRLPLSEYSPIFDRDAIQRSFSFPFKIPASLRNKKLLEYPTRIDGAGQRKYNYAEVRLAGQQYERGTLVITGSTKDEIEVAFKSEILELIENLNNFRLRNDLNIEVDTQVDFAPNIQLYYLKPDPQEEDYTTLYLSLGINGVLYEDKLSRINSFVSDINADFPNLAIVAENNDNELILEFRTIYKPDLQLSLEPDSPNNTEDFFQYSPSGTDDFDAYLTSYASHIEDVQAGLDTTHAFPVIYAPNFYDKDNDAWKEYINYTDRNSDLILTTRKVSEKAEHTLVPMPSVRTVFEYIFDAAGSVPISGSFFSDSDINKLIVYNNRSIDTILTKTDFILERNIANINERRYIGYLGKYYLEDHLPDLTFREFVQKFSTMFPIVMQLRYNSLEIDTVKALLSNTTIDLTDYTLKDWTKKHTQYSGYELTYERFQTPEEDTDYLQDFSGGTTDDDILRHKSEFFTHYFIDITDQISTDEQGLNGRLWRVPIDSFEGSSLPGNSNSEIDLRLLFNFGQQADDEGNLYPYASFLPQNLNGTSVGEYSLEWDGEKGLYLQNWKEYIELLTADEITIKLLLPIQKIIELKQNITTAIYVRHPDGSFRGLIKKLSFSVGIETNSMMLCTAVVAKL